jgi:osmotically-inducible protein OsmY
LQLGVNTPPDDPVDDAWITTKIRGQMLADSSIDPHQFKIVTYNRIVYIMGEAIASQAQEVISLAQECAGVRRVVKLLTYYHLSKSP